MCKREANNSLNLNFVNIQLFLDSFCELDNPSDYGSKISDYTDMCLAA